MSYAKAMLLLIGISLPVLLNEDAYGEHTKVNHCKLVFIHPDTSFSPFAFMLPLTLFKVWTIKHFLVYVTLYFCMKIENNCFHYIFM